MTEQVQQIRDRLKELGYRITLSRLKLVELLVGNPKPLAIGEISRRIQVDRATIYRNLNLFLELDIVKEIHFDDGKMYYELSDNFRGHHHHLICLQCGKVKALRNCSIKDWEDRILREKGFQVEYHTLEFFGICRDCRRSSH